MAFDKIFRGPPDDLENIGSESSPQLGIDVVGGLLYINYGNGWEEIIPGSVSNVGSVPNFADDEFPAGTIDGVNTVFTLAHSPNPPTSLKVIVNGICQLQGDIYDYTLSNNVFTFNTPPTLGSLIWCFYRY